jgi:chromosome segregation protein
MHIKKLEIVGFKSFVDRTVIHFDHDVIGIVGPNGCGKSNIVDAIRWCMGEQSAKHLRGRAMEDVIFNGSESRPPHGLAEVTLTFDNSDPAYAELLPLEYKDYAEIAVTRRLYRDGTSEYLINKTLVRLRDITDLFLGTGVGTKAYSIVEQGRIGQIVSARPQDRRLFLEEAAGITKYKQRKKQAERQMELTRQNLLRISDIVTEVDRNRASLKRQAAKAERFIEYRKELEDLMLHDASHRLLEMIVMARVKSDALHGATQRVSSVSQELDEKDQALARARAEAADIEQRSEACSKGAFEADNQVATLQAEADRSRDRLNHLGQRLEAGKAEQADLTVRLADLASEQQGFVEKIEQLGQEEKARDDDASNEERVLETLRGAETSAEAELQTARDRIADLTAQIATSEARIEMTRQRNSDAIVQRDRLIEERGELIDNTSHLDTKKTALSRSLSDLAQGKRLSGDELGALEQELVGLRPQVLEGEKRLDQAKNELGLKRNRLRVLEDLHRRFEGIGAGPRALLNRQDPKVMGLIADRLEVPAELTRALAGLVGDRLQALVVEGAEHGLDLLAELRDEGRGRASLYIAGLAEKQAHPALAPEVLQDSQIRGLLKDQIHYDAQDAALVRKLIGETVVVATPRDALEVCLRHAGLTAVALDGTVVHPDGLISGGSGDSVAAAMVEHKREMRELSVEVEQLGEQFATLSREHTLLKDRIVEIETSRDQARQGAHEQEIEHVSTEKDLGNIGSEIERMARRLAGIDQEIVVLNERMAEGTRDEHDTQERIDQQKADLEQAKQLLGNAETLLGEQKERSVAQATLVTERKVRLAQVREQLEAARSALGRVAALQDELLNRQSRLTVEMQENESSHAETSAHLVMLAENQDAAQLAATAAHQQLDEVRQLLEQIRSALGIKDEELRGLRQSLAQAQEDLRHGEMDVQKIDLEREHLIGNVRERFRGLDLPRVVGDYHARPAPDAEHRRRIDELSKLIDRMGPVNLDAKAEYESEEKRFAEMSAQKIDIEQALMNLEKSIQHMNRESKRRFKETFDAVSALFSATFQRMFKGGRAELQLTEPENMLETGIDIIAQPPGKKLSNIELMSGGEKALTATSLIFAIFQHKPSPFCVLDEVDAPLDEANVARYNEAIRAMTDRSQFILITHIKKTMQSVDVLYGVTMGEPGVSRLVSVKVNENAVSRSERGAGQLDQAPASEPELGAQVA